MPTTSEYLEQLKTDKANLISILNERGVSTTGTETFTDLVPKTLDIKTPPVLQNKNITITENTTTNISADTGYDGLNTVSITTNVSGGETPTKGIIPTKWNENGWVTEAKTVGFTSLPTFYLGAYNTNSGTFNIYSNAINRYLTKIKLNEGITTLGNDSLKNLTTLQEVELPNSITNMGARVFYYDSALNISTLPNNLISIGMYCFQNTNISIKTLPDSCTTLNYGAFASCRNIKQVSMKNVTQLNGTGEGNGNFYSCTSLKGIWVGSAITAIDRYAFVNCSNVKKMYIDLPRATVEAMANYTYAFSNNAFTTDKIICNDDADFITKEEFDAIDWSTQ